jgi:hypothetical protein
MRKTLIVFLIAILGLSITMIAGVRVFAAKSGDLVYEIKNSKVEIVKYVGHDKDFKLPDKINGFPVATIDKEAFKYRSIIKISIPRSVTNIEFNAFKLVSSLEEIDVDESNPNYSSKDGVLFDKNKSKLIAFPIRKIGYDYSIPESVKIISPRAFQNCTYFANLYIPDSVQSIGYYAFKNCDILSSLVIPENVSHIGYGAFIECKKLLGIYFLGDAPKFDDERNFDPLEVSSKFSSKYHVDNSDNLNPEFNKETFESIKYSNFVIYYIQGKTGFTNPFRGIETIGLKTISHFFFPYYSITTIGFCILFASSILLKIILIFIGKRRKRKSPPDYEEYNRNWANDYLFSVNRYNSLDMHKTVGYGVFLALAPKEYQLL